MKSLENLTLTRVYSAVTLEHRTGLRRHVERRNSYAISFSFGGRIEYRHGDDVIISDEGSVIIHPMGACYDFRCTRAGAFGVLNFFTTHFFTEKFIKVELDTAPVRKRFAEIKAALSTGGSHHLVMALTYEMLEYICRFREEGSEILRSAKRALLDGFTRADFSISELAASVHVSESYLRRVFADELGISPKKALMAARISHAKQLLSEGNLPIARVGEACGFSGVYHFSRAFRSETGQAPSEFRRLSKESARLVGWQM